MSSSQSVPNGQRAFKRIAHKPLTRGVINRKPPFANVKPTGLVELSSAACEALDALARAAGLDVAAYSIGFGADEDGQQMSLYPEPLNSPGSSGFVRNSKVKRYSFSVASVFSDAPLLRPVIRRKCPALTGVDAQNAPCLIIALNSSLEFPIIPKKTKKNSTAKQAPTTATPTQTA